MATETIYCDWFRHCFNKRLSFENGETRVGEHFDYLAGGTTSIRSSFRHVI